MSLDELKKIIQDKYLHKGDFTLSSGAKSDKYFDIKGLMCSYEDSYYLEEPLLQMTHHIPYKILGGTELGGVPLAQFLAFRLGDDYCIIRKQQRIHGLKKMIEGQPKSPILLVDDVLSTGHSVKDAIRVCHNEGYEVAGLLCVIDRTYVEDYSGKRYYDAPPGLWFHDIKPIGNEKNHLDGLDLPVYALFKEREDDPLGSYNPNSIHLFKE